MPYCFLRIKILLCSVEEYILISFNHVSHNFGAFKLKDITFHVDDGEYFVIIGPTGAGKTLILEIIAGFYNPSEGNITLNDQNALTLPPENRNIGFVYQDYALFPHMTVQENISFGLEMQGLSSAEIERKVFQTMETLKISKLNTRYPINLSGGEMQRVALARALVVEPKILLLDEPLSALDTRTREALRRELKRLHEIKGITTIHVTHDQNDALLPGDRIAVIIDGEMVQIGSPLEVYNEPTSLKVAEFTRVENILEGEIKKYQDGVATIGIKNYSLKVSSHIREGHVYVVIRPEDIILSKVPLESSAQNMLECTITEVSPFGLVYHIRVDKGFSSVVTKQSIENLELAKGSQIYASFKATAAHIIRK